MLASKKAYMVLSKYKDIIEYLKSGFYTCGEIGSKFSVGPAKVYNIIQVLTLYTFMTEDESPTNRNARFHIEYVFELKEPKEPEKRHNKEGKFCEFPQTEYYNNYPVTDAIRNISR